MSAVFSDTVSRETLKRFFGDNLAMLNYQLVVFTPESHTETILAKHSLAAGPRPPAWALEQEIVDRQANLDAEQATRRANDHVDKFTLDQLLAIDIAVYAPD